MPSSVVLQNLDRSFVFKRARVFSASEHSPTLRELLSTAIERLPSPDERTWSREEEERQSVMTVLNFEQREERSVFGEVMKTFPGQPTFAAEKDTTKNRYRLLEILPPNDRAEFIRGVLFFYVYGDGVVIMPTNTFKATELDAYLTWLLRSAGVLSGEESVNLIDEPFSVLEENIDHLSGASSVCLSASMAQLLGYRAPDVDSTKSTFAMAVQKVAETLNRAATEAKPGLVPISPSDVSDSADLDITIEVKLPPRQRSTEHVLDAIAIASRAFAGVTWSASLKSGFRLGSGRSQVTRHKKVLHENRYPSYLDARSKMSSTMQELIESGLIGFLGVREEV
ncbi:MAG: hypothetical protein IT353_18935 [Gemmatimonadaceae bacterium]|nr:hypothetical protein [Gemmatimonadaceae bacterium]